LLLLKALTDKLKKPYQVKSFLHHLTGIQKIVLGRPQSLVLIVFQSSIVNIQLSWSTITMNRIQQKVMHAVHERFQDLETYNFRGVPEVRKFYEPLSSELFT